MNLMKGLNHHFGLLVDNLFFSPEIAVQILHPFKIADSYAAAISQDIRDNEHALFLENLVCLRSGRSVGALNNNACAHVCGILLRQLQLNSARSQHSDLHRQQLRISNRLAAGVADNAARFLGISIDIIAVKAVRLINSTVNIAQGDNLHARVAEKLRRPAADIAKALHSRSCFIRLDALHLQCLQRRHHNAAAGSRRASEGAAHADSLAGDEARLKLSGNLAVFVHHPAHNLRISIHIGSRNILLLADKRRNLVNIATRQGLQLALRQLRRVYNNAALAAAIRQSGNSTFAGHPERQCLDLIHADILMIAHTALGRTENCTMLTAITGKNPCAAIIHLHRNRHFQRALRCSNNSCCASVELHNFNRLIQRNVGHFKNVHRLRLLTY